MGRLIWFIFTVLSLTVNAEDCPGFRDYDAITGAVTQKFYDKKFKGLKWSERIAARRAQVKCKDEPAAVADAVNVLLSELHTSHTQVYTQKDLDYWGLKSVFAKDLGLFKVPVSGIWPVKVDGKWHAKFVLQGSSAEAAGVLAGDELLSLDGGEFRPLGFTQGKSSVLVFSHDGSSRLQAGIRPSFVSVQQAFLDATKKSARILPAGGKKIGYFHLWCGTHDGFLSVQQWVLSRFKKQKVDGLIIDYRDGFGGANPEYLDAFMNDPFLKKVRKVFLINEGVRSGKEWLSAIVKRDKLGTLIGVKTAGAFIAGSPINLSDERYFLYLAVSEFNPPDIPKLEGIGVEPDELAAGCGRYCGGVDPQMARALTIF